MQLRPVSYMPLFSTLILDSLFEPDLKSRAKN
jgi:hypothetical protein